MTMKKRMVAGALSLMLGLTMIMTFSAAVFAEDEAGVPEISMGAGNIEKGNKVYMGLMGIPKPFSSQDVLYPVSWIVLGNANSTDLNDGNASVEAKNARLLITEKTQEPDMNSFDGEVNNVWQGSCKQAWCKEVFLGGHNWSDEGFSEHFTYPEKEAMLYTSKKEEYEEGFFHDGENNWGESSLENEQVFYLSAEEVSDSYGYFSGNESRKASRYDSDENSTWGLRSPYYLNSYPYYYAAYIKTDGKVEFDNYELYCGARPAVNINLNNVLFTSPAEGGKASGATSADGLKAVGKTKTNEWKLTLYDSHRSSFTAAAATDAVLSQDQGYSSWSIPVTYSMATPGNREYISAIICDGSGNAVYYGNIKAIPDNNSASGTVDVVIPEGLSAGDYKLHIFSENVNGDESSNYASHFRTIDFKVTGYMPGNDVPKANPLKIKGKTANVKYSKLKKKSQTLKASGVIKTIEEGQGDLSYRFVSAKKGSKSFKKYFRINKKTGEITVKKGLKKGTYKVAVKVRAAGNASYQASRLKKVTFKVRVR